MKNPNYIKPRESPKMAVIRAGEMQLIDDGIDTLSIGDIFMDGFTGKWYVHQGISGKKVLNIEVNPIKDWLEKVSRLFWAYAES